MTHHIPHGVYVKLSNFLYTKKDTLSERTLFFFKDGYREYILVDNGYTGRDFWRFFNYSAGHFDFGTEYLPMKVEITDKEYTFINSKGREHCFRPEAGQIFLQVLEAYYGKGVPQIIINDRRKENIQKLIEWKQKQIDLKIHELDQLKSDMKRIEDIDHINRYGSP